MAWALKVIQMHSCIGNDADCFGPRDRSQFDKKIATYVRDHAPIDLNGKSKTRMVGMIIREGKVNIWAG